jgi:hypothetical protein
MASGEIKNERPLLSDLMPEVAEELRTLISKSEFPELANQISGLRIVDRCQCGENSCATFYTAPPPNGAWGPGHENVLLDTKDGFFVLDLLNQKIVCVDVLDRKDIKKKLDEVFPLKKTSKR